MRKLFIKESNYRKVWPANLEKARYCVLKGLDNCISSWCSENSTGECFFLECINHVTHKIVERTIHLANNLHRYKHTYCLLSPVLKITLNKIHKHFVVDPMNKATKNINLVCRKFCGSVIAKKLGLNNNSSTDAYCNINIVPENNIINKNKGKLICADDIPIENNQLSHRYWMSKIYESPPEDKFIVASPKSLIKPLARIITSIFQMLLRKTQSYNDKCRFLELSFRYFSEFGKIHTRKTPDMFYEVFLYVLNTR